MQHQRKYYGDDFLFETREVNEDGYRALLASLPPEERERVIGYRKVAVLTAPEDGED